jgi:hypothetical protein
MLQFFPPQYTPCNWLVYDHIFLVFWKDYLANEWDVGATKFKPLKIY